MTHGTGVGNMVDQWNNIAFDDSSWNHATEYGQNSDAGNYWYSHMNRPVDRVSEDARWIWTEDATTHDSVCPPSSPLPPSLHHASALSVRF